MSRTIKDVEQAVFGCSTYPNSNQQKYIRRILREASLGVGQGNRYEFDEAEFKYAVELVREKRHQA